MLITAYLCEIFLSEKRTKDDMPEFVKHVVYLFSFRPLIFL